ncbi:MAG: VanZ family protein [Bacteroidales bacterium]|nr:VanZ family protein [Bacteroidales bacterium]
MHLKNFFPVFLWVLVILVLTGLPGNYFPHITSFWDWLSPDKLIHLLMFAVLVFLFMIANSKQYNYRNKRYYYIIGSLFISIFLGALTEILQKFVFIGRHANIYDFYANTLGCFLGIILFFIVQKKIIKKIKS